VKDVETMDQHVSYTAPDFVSMALITIDTQRDTLDGQPLEIPGTSAILPRMQRLLQTFRKIEMPIVHMIRLYKEDGSNVDLCRRSMVESGAAILRPGSPGIELATELLPEPDIRLDAELLLSGAIQQIAPGEVVIYKPRWGAFFNTALEAHLQDLGVSSLAFMGCNFPNCPRTSVYEASERDFRIVLVDDTVSGLYDRGTEEMRNMGVRPMSAKELERAVVSANAVGVNRVRGGR
jgi:nicotinamidase-related amidase